MTYLTKIPLYLASALIAAMVLTGCQATIDTRWATTNDTLDHWEPLAATMPVEIRGQWPNASREQIARAIPHAVLEPSSADAAPGPRFVVEIGSNAPGTDNAYCAAPASGQTATGVATTLTLTLCDGSRMVARSSSPMNAANVTPAELSRKIGHLENLALIGIEKNEPRLVETMD